MRSNSENGRSLLMTAAAALCWSIGGLGIRIVNVPPWGIVFWRSLFMGLTILGFLIMRDRKRIFQTFEKIGIPGLAAGASLAIAFTFFVLAISHTSVANTLVLQGTSPIFSALFGWLILHERARAETWLAIIVTMAGVIVMVSDSLATGKLLGDMLGLGVAIALASNIILVRATSEVDMIPAACLGGFLSASLAIPMMNTFTIPACDLGILAILGAIQLGLGFCLFVTGSRNLPPAQTGLLTSLDTVLGSLWVWLFIGEQPTTNALIGGTIIIVTLTLHTFLKGEAYANSSGSRRKRF